MRFARVAVRVVASTESAFCLCGIGLLVREFLPQRQTLRHAKAVLLVDDGQPQVFELHLVLNDGVGADHQGRLAAGHQRQHGVAFFFLLAAGQPRHLQTQRGQHRRQPTHQFGEMLLGQYFRGCHQGALPTCVDALRCCERRHHGFARAHIALQQAVHGHGTRHVIGNFSHHPLLGLGECERQGSVQLRQHPFGAVAVRQHWGIQQLPLALGLQLRELLRQQFFGFEPLPSRMRVVFQLRQRHIGCRVVQKLQRLRQAPTVRRQMVGGNGFGKGLAAQRVGQTAQHGFAQIGLRQLGGAGVDGGQGGGQVATCGLNAGVHHGAAHEAAAHLAAQTHLPPHFQRLLHVRVEVEKSQRAGVAAIVHHRLQLAARLEHHLAAFHHRFNLNHLAIAAVCQLHQLGFILIAHWQVQRQVHRAQQTHFAQGFLRQGQGFALGRWGGHGCEIVPADVHSAHRALQLHHNLGGHDHENIHLARDSCQP